MKVRCERDGLVEALGTAGRAVSGRGGLPGLSGVRAELQGDQLRLTGSDLDLTITVSVTVAQSALGTVRHWVTANWPDGPASRGTASPGWSTATPASRSPSC